MKAKIKINMNIFLKRLDVTTKFNALKNIGELIGSQLSTANLKLNAEALRLAYFSA